MPEWLNLEDYEAKRGAHLRAQNALRRSLTVSCGDWSLEFQSADLLAADVQELARREGIEDRDVLLDEWEVVRQGACDGEMLRCRLRAHSLADAHRIVAELACVDRSGSETKFSVDEEAPVWHPTELALAIARKDYVMLRWAGGTEDMAEVVAKL